LMHFDYHSAELSGLHAILSPALSVKSPNICYDVRRGLML